LVSQISPSAGSPLLWRVEGKPVTVHLDPGVKAELSTRALATTAAETGGLLLGRSEPEGEGFITRIKAFEPFPLDAQYGTAYVLSHRDRVRLRSRMARAARGELQVVGCWRTHQRRGLYLDQRDFTTFQLCFPDPSAVFLVIKAEDGAARGGFFIWEAGDVQRHASYSEFPLGEAAAPPLKSPAPSHRLRTTAIAAAALAMPVAAYLGGRAVALNQQRPAPVAAPLPLVSIELTPPVGAPLEAGDLFVPPAIATKQLPRIPAGMNLEHHPRVILAVRVDPEGRVLAVTARDGDSRLAEGAAAAVRGWTFTPARLNRVPVACDVQVRFIFRNP